MELWKHIGISAWPSLALVGPDGKLLYFGAGETQIPFIEVLIDAALEFYQDSLDSTPIQTTLEDEKNPQTEFCFPAKLAFDEANEYLFISDSNHNQIVSTKLDFSDKLNPTGQVLFTIGSGTPSLVDGDFGSCTFNNPQGICYHTKGNKLYVADTGNHCIRELDLLSKQVKTLAGTGQQLEIHKFLKCNNQGTCQALNSPWDLVLNHDQTELYIAMAGSHQIWTYNFQTQVASVYSGSGAESSGDSENPAIVTWAQPSGLALLDDLLVVADSESSKIRAINLIKSTSHTFAGGSSYQDDLKAFGDVDGSGYQAKFQHPLGVITSKNPLPFSGNIIVADTYNHKIKILCSSSGEVSSWLGNGLPGNKDGKLSDSQFNEPSGFALVSRHNILFIADTNNHSIRMVDISSGTVSTIKFMIQSQNQRESKDMKLTTGCNVEKIEVGPVSISKKNSNIEVKLNFQPSSHLNEDAPSQWKIIDYDNQLFDFLEMNGTTESCGFRIPYSLKEDSSNEISTITLEAIFYVCNEDNTCSMKETVVVIQLKIVQNENTDVQLSF